MNNGNTNCKLVEHHLVVPLETAFRIFEPYVFLVRVCYYGHSKIAIWCTWPRLHGGVIAPVLGQ